MIFKKINLGREEIFLICYNSIESTVISKRGKIRLNLENFRIKLFKIGSGSSFVI